MNLPELSLKRPITVLVVIIVFVTIGIISLTKLPLEMLPDTSFPGLMVYVPYPSSSPEEVERKITRYLEDILSTVNNLKNLRSTSSSTNSRIFMEFQNGTNMDMASLEIRDKIDQIRNQLPDDIERLTIRRWSTSDRPVISCSVSVPGELNDLYFMAENIIQPELERIEGVANVEIRGLRNKELQITLKPDLFYSSSINILDLITTIRNNNINISAGYIEDQKRYSVRIPGELKIASHISNLSLNDKGLKIKDIASVQYDYPVKESFYKLNGKDSLSFRIYRASGANVVNVCNRVKAAFGNLKKTNPNLKKMDTLFFRDQSDDILNSLRDLSLSGIIGGLLAVLVLFFFLRKLRTTIIIALAIPLSVLFTFALMYLLRSLLHTNISINIISLSGLMMAVGMLVDNGVVVLENIFRLRQEKGYSPLVASVKGSSEVALAVFASTMTTLVVFISISFVQGSGFGRYMKDFALTISLALVASLLISLTFIPLIGSKLLHGKTREKARWLVRMTNGYGKLITLTIKNWKTKILTLAIALALLATAIMMFLNIEAENMPSSEERELSVSIYMPMSFSLPSMIALFDQYDEILLRNRENLAIKTMTSYYGIERKRQGRYRGSIDLYLKETGPTISEIKKKLQSLFPQKPGISMEFGQRHGRGGHRHGINVELTGLDYTQLTELVPVVTEKLRTIEEIEDLISDLEGGDTQLLVKVNRKKAESSGINTRRVAQTIMSSISDRPIGKFKTENKEIDILLKMDKDAGFSENDLKNISMRSNQKQIPISAISQFSYKMGSTAISKENKKSRLRISVNTNAKGMKKLTAKISDVMATIQFPEGYGWSFGSRWQRMQESQKGITLAIILALCFIYIIMASLFESFIHPFTILFTVPLALFGVAVFFFMTDTTLNDISWLGVLILMGIVVNNGIILIDHIRKLRLSGMPKNQAIITGGRDRLRPIVMTAITTIFGVLPLALPILFPGVFSASQGRAQMWAPISVAILGGLTTSTFFTLIILPTFYSIADTATTRFKKALKLESRNQF